jgi:hypothetical protein
MSFSSSWYSEFHKVREAEYRHLCQCRKIYKQVVENQLLDPDGGYDPHHHAKELWAEGVNRKILLNGTFDQFLGFLRETWEYGSYSSEPYYKRSRGNRWGDSCNSHGVFFRHGPGYTRLPHHAKKEPVELNPKQAWRAHKQFARDKHCQHRRHHNAGPWGKRQVHRSNRTFVRQKLHAERWDEISQNVQDVVRCWWD